MADKNKHSRLGNLVLGLVVIGFGVFPVLAAFDIGPLGTKDINGPPWLGIAAGGVFVVAGLILMLGESFPLLKNLLGVLIVVGLAALGNWIAFGVGDRVCTGTSFLFGFGSGAQYSDLACRIPFGFGAVIIDAFLFYAIVKLFQKSLGGPPKLALLMKIAEGLLMISLSPFLVFLFLFVGGSVGFDAVKTRLKTGAWPRNEKFIQRRKK